MARVYISIGSNIDREQHILAALDALQSCFSKLILSSVYESEAVGFDGSPFYNLVVGIDTQQSVAELSASFKQLEADNGRRRDVPKFSGRTLDLDILTYDDQVGTIDGVELPRGEILKNAFVLLPLAEIAPNELHPVLRKSYQELWDAYDKNQKLWPVSFTWQGQKISSPAH